jgi:hypothetical protein
MSVELQKKIEELTAKMDTVNNTLVNSTNVKLDTVSSKLDTLNNTLVNSTNVKLDTVSSKLDALNNTLAITNRCLTTFLQQDISLWRINNNGDVIWVDSFEDNNLKWIVIAGGGGSWGKSYDYRCTYHGNASAYMGFTTDPGCFVQADRRFGVPHDITGVGFELAFMSIYPVANNVFNVRMALYGPTVVKWGWVRWYPAQNILRVEGTTTRDFQPQICRYNYAWNKLKVTVNFEAGTFLNLFCNNLKAKINNINLYSDVGPGDPYLEFRIGTANTAATDRGGAWWIDNFILTINEPLVEV